MECKKFLKNLNNLTKQKICNFFNFILRIKKKKENFEEIIDLIKNEIKDIYENFDNLKKFFDKIILEKFKSGDDYKEFLKFEKNFENHFLSKFKFPKTIKFFIKISSEIYVCWESEIFKDFWKNEKEIENLNEIITKFN